MDYGRPSRGQDDEEQEASIPSIQERRMQLEAFQAERALGKSMRASVRGNGRPLRSSGPLNQSVYGARARLSPSTHAGGEHGRGLTLESSTIQTVSSARSIIRHYDSLSKPTDALRGVRHRGTAAPKIEKRFAPISRSTITPSQSRSPAFEVSGSQAGLESTDMSFTGITGLRQVDYENAQSTTASLNSSVYQTTSTKFMGTRSVRQERQAVVEPGKRQEELYLSQARLLQWYTMGKEAIENFQSQEKSAKAQFEMVGKSILDKQAELLSLQKRFEVEQELVHLESTLDAQRDQLQAIVLGLETFKDSYEHFTSALSREARVLHLPGIDDTNLELWLGQIQDCRRTIEATLKHSQKDRLLLQGVAYIMRSLCDTVEMEVQELKTCTALLSSIREAETRESSLTASGLYR